MKKEYSRFEDSTVFEGIVSVRTLIEIMTEGGISNDRKIQKLLISRDRAEKEKKELSWLGHRAEELGFEIELTDREVIDTVAVGNTHGGMIAYCTERSLNAPSEENIKENGFYVMLEGIEDPYNFGYCLRSLYAAGVDGILVGPRNWLGAAGVVCRASAGASELFEIGIGDTEDIVDLFHEKGYTVYAADKTEDAVPVYDTEVRFPVLLVVGGEKRGITRAVLEKCDKVISLDYGRRFGAALSAASASSILAFEIYRQNRGEVK